MENLLALVVLIVGIAALASLAITGIRRRLNHDGWFPRWPIHWSALQMPYALALLFRLINAHFIRAANSLSTSNQAIRPYTNAKAWALLYAVITVCLSAFLFLYGLDGYPLFDTNGGLYAEIAREMLDSGEYVVPHLLGVPYIEKPPLLYWSMAGAFSLFGLSEASARYVSAVPMLCLAMGMLLFHVVHGHPRAGWFAALILSAMLPVTLLSHAILFDPLLTALFGGALLCFLHAYVVQSRNWIRMSALFLGLATLEKGGVAPMLAIGIGALFFVQTRDYRGMRWLLLDPVSMMLFALVTIPWHVTVLLQQDDFAWFYFINEHVLRFLGMREPHDYHVGSPAYYLPRLLALFLPWTPLLLSLAWCRTYGASRSAQALHLLCRAWILFPVVFFSMSQAKAQYYVMVVTPGVALWAGMALDVRMRGQPSRLLAHGLGACLATSMAAAGAVWLMPRDAWPPVGSFNLDLATTGAAILAVAGLAWHLTARWVQWFWFRPDRWEWVPILISVFSAVTLVGALAGVASRSMDNSSRHLAQLITAENLRDRTIFAYRDFEDVFSSLPFYLDKQIRIIDSASSDLQFGCAHTEKEQSACIAMADFARYSLRNKVAVVVTKRRLQQFKLSMPGMQWHSMQSGEKAVLFN